MKKSLIVAVILFAGIVTSCNESKKEVKQEATTEQEVNKEVVHEAAKYQCPMQCEGEKTYAEPGACPVCKMDLKKVVSEEESHEGHSHE